MIFLITCQCGVVSDMFILSNSKPVAVKWMGKYAPNVPWAEGWTWGLLTLSISQKEIMFTMHNILWIGVNCRNGQLHVWLGDCSLAAWALDRTFCRPAGCIKRDQQWGFVRIGRQFTEWRWFIYSPKHCQCLSINFASTKSGAFLMQITSRSSFASLPSWPPPLPSLVASVELMV